MSVRKRIFESELAASLYSLVTNQDIWLEHATRMLDEIDELDRGINVLDVGCGPGTSTRALGRVLREQDNLVGLDLSRSMIGHAKRHDPDLIIGGDIPYVVGNAASLPFPDASMDLVTGHSFLYLIPDRVGVLHEIKRVLRPSGTLVFLEPNGDFSLRRCAFEGVRHSGRIVSQPRDTALFLASMVGWRVASRIAGRLTRETVGVLFDAAGYQDVRVDERFGGLGLLCVARVPAEDMK